MTPTSSRARVALVLASTLLALDVVAWAAGCGSDNSGTPLLDCNDGGCGAAPTGAGGSGTTGGSTGTGAGTGSGSGATGTDDDGGGAGSTGISDGGGSGNILPTGHREHR